jgi:hypothetical protein
MYHIIIFFGQRGLWPPRPRRFLITHSDASQSIGLLWTSVQLVAESTTWQHTTHTQHTHNRQTSTPPVGFEPTIAAGERPQTYELDGAATGRPALLWDYSPKYFVRCGILAAVSVISKSSGNIMPCFWVNRSQLFGLLDSEDEGTRRRNYITAVCCYLFLFYRRYIWHRFMFHTRIFEVATKQCFQIHEIRVPQYVISSTNAVWYFWDGRLAKASYC